MNNRDEFNQIRAELARVQQNVTRLGHRLDELEARQTADQPVAAPSPEMPPPLPAAALKRAEPPAPVAAASAVATPPPAAAPATPPAVPPAIPKRPAPPVEKKPRRFGPAEDMGWEMALTTYWLPRIGILMLAMGTVWGFTFVAHQFRDAAWMPYARVGLGYVLALVLGGLGRWLEKKYPGYARVLMGGGFGLLYFVTFATWYIPQTRISPSQEFTLFLLGLLVFAWGAVAEWRKSQLIALTMTLLGHFTVALSTLSLDTPSRAAVGGLLVLGTGSAWFLVRNGWYAVAMSAMIGSYLNQFFWLYQSPPSDAAMDFVIGMAVLAAYLVLYALADRLTPAVYAASKTRTRNVYCGANTGGFLLLGLVLMQGFDFARDREYLLYFATALFAGGMGWSYTRHDGQRDSLANIYFTKASVLATAGLAVWLDGASVTLSIALQSLVLLIAARQSRQPIGRLLSLGTAVVAFVHGCYTLSRGSMPAFGDPGHTGYALVILATAAAFWVVAELYRLTPWHTFATEGWRCPAVIRDLCRSLEILPSEPGAPVQASRIGLSHLLVGFGAILLAGNTDALLPRYHAAPTIGLLALGAAALGLAQRSAPVLAGGLFFSAMSVCWWLTQLYGPPAREAHTLLMAAGCLLPLLAISELYRLLLPGRFAVFEHHGDLQGAWLRNRELMALLLATAAALVIATGLQERTEVDMGMLLAGAAALAATAYAAAGNAANAGLLGALMVLFTIILAPQLEADSTRRWMPLLGTVLLGIAATATEARWWGEKRPGLACHRLLPSPYVLYGVGAWNVLWLADALCRESAVPVVLAAAAIAFALAMPWLHARAMASTATALAGVALLAWLADGGRGETGWWRFAALVLVTTSLAGDRYFDRCKPFTRPWPGRLLLVIAWITCQVYNGEMATNGWNYTGSAFIALGYLGYCALFRTRTAAALSLAAAVLTTAPLMIDATPGMALAPLWAAYVSLIAYWLCAERGVTIALERTKFPLAPGHETTFNLLLTGIPTLLGVLCLTRVDVIQSFYLTMGWTAWGLAIFCWALVTRQPWFRYMGLATFALALSRAFLVDVWRLEGLYRVGAMLFLGAALLAVAYGYTRWRANQEEAARGADTKKVEED